MGAEQVPQRTDSQPPQAPAKNKEASDLVAGMIGLPLALAGVYGFATRSTAEFFAFAISVAVVICGFFVVIIIQAQKQRRLENNQPWTKNEWLTTGAVMLIVAANAAFALHGVYAVIVDGSLWLARRQEVQELWLVLHQSWVLVAAATLILGIFLYELRLHFRCVYGFSEVMVGIVVASIRAPDLIPIKDPAFYLAVLTAGVYLVVRGLDNISVGLRSEKKDRVAIALIQVFKRFTGSLLSRMGVLRGQA